jgi:hypothetical protein
MIVTFLFSALPEWNTPQFIMNSVVSSILVIIMVVSWRLVELKVRYFSIQSYCLVFVFPFCLPIRLLNTFGKKEILIRDLGSGLYHYNSLKGEYFSSLFKDFRK